MGSWKKYKRIHVVLLGCFISLLTVSITAVVKTIVDDDGPFMHWINFEIDTRIDRSKTSYNYLPEYSKTDEGGYFDSYTYNYYTKGSIGRVTYDTPFWPKGDPGLGSANPLPPLIIHHEIYAIRPETAAYVIATLWMIWIVLIVASLCVQQYPKRSRGFEVMQRSNTERVNWSTLRRRTEEVDALNQDKSRHQKPDPGDGGSATASPM